MSKPWGDFSEVEHTSHRAAGLLGRKRECATYGFPWKRDWIYVQRHQYKIDDLLQYRS